MKTDEEQEWQYRFAGMAMHALIVRGEMVKSELAGTSGKDPEDYARVAVNYADALIKELTGKALPF
jgi:hypothetical protein